MRAWCPCQQFSAAFLADYSGRPGGASRKARGSAPLPVIGRWLPPGLSCQVMDCDGSVTWRVVVEPERDALRSVSSAARPRGLGARRNPASPGTISLGPAAGYLAALSAERVPVMRSSAGGGCAGGDPLRYHAGG